MRLAKKGDNYYIYQHVKKGGRWTTKTLASLGKLSEEAAAEELKKWKMKMGLSKIYRTIVIDPPWPIEKIERKVRPKQKAMDYEMMSLEEIMHFPLRNFVSKDGCHIYLWTTQKHLQDAFKVLRVWGVKYQCLLTWIKNVGFTPFSFMYSTEFVLFGMVGNLSLIRKGVRTDFKGKVREHSRKPDDFYGIVRRVSPEPRIDIFSREEREGFDSYGYEVGGLNERIR